MQGATYRPSEILLGSQRAPALLFASIMASQELLDQVNALSAYARAVRCPAMTHSILAQVIEFVKTDKALHDVLTTIGVCVALLFSISLFLERKPASAVSTWFPDPIAAPAKRACEIWFLSYGVVWISVFGVTISTGIYNWFDKIHFMVFCVGLASPLLLQPFLAPSITADSGKPLLERFSVKANIWIAIFSFIGNYW